LGQIVQALRGSLDSPMHNTVSASLTGAISNKDMSEASKP
jgi:hypothetical protein